MTRTRFDQWGTATFLGDTEERVPVHWVYDTEYPWSLQLMVGGMQPVMRFVSRDLLNAGVSVQAGDNNFWMTPRFFDQPAGMRFYVHVVDGLTLQLDVPRTDVIDLLDEVESMVPFGEEAKHQDWIGGIEYCLGRSA